MNFSITQRLFNEDFLNNHSVNQKQKSKAKYSSSRNLARWKF